MPNSLAGKRVLVTRPKAQAQAILDALSQQGAEAWHFPLIDIAPISTAKPAELQQDLSNHDLAIFISPNAVSYLAKALGEHAKLPESLRLAAIGRGTAQELSRLFERTADILPAQAHKQDSEALLENPQLAKHRIENQRIVIIRGQGGREHLAGILRQRKATVDYLEVYQRLKPATDPRQLNQSIASQQLDAILITSREALANLLQLVEEQYRAQLQRIPLLVIHPRQVEEAEARGFSRVYLCRNTDTDMLVDMLKNIN